MLLGVFGTLVLSFGIFQLDFASSDNDIIRRYQTQKIVSSEKIETLIVGDSSAGNAIDATYFTELSGDQTTNLALTGSFGLVGTYEMIHEVSVHHPELKNVIIIHTLDIWRRPFAKEGLFELRRGQNLFFWSSFFDRSPVLSYLEYAGQFKNILRAGRALLAKTPLGSFIPSDAQILLIDETHDYLKQESSTYKNGEKTLQGDEKLSSLIDEDKQKIFSMIDNLCGERKLNCLYLHGPIHEMVYHNSLPEVEAIHEKLQSAENIVALEKIFEYKNNQMGDSINHVDVSGKRTVTKDYFDYVKKYLK